MKRIVLLRHGESLWNKENRFTGWTDVDLSEKGVEEKSKNYLLVRKDALLDYLKTHHKKILWYVLGEKNIIGLHSYNNIPNLPMWLVVSGTYTLDEEGKVTGCMRTSHER